jgi:hypothetical protein
MAQWMVLQLQVGPAHHCPHICALSLSLSRYSVVMEQFIILWCCRELVPLEPGADGRVYRCYGR